MPTKKNSTSKTKSLARSRVVASRQIAAAVSGIDWPRTVKATLYSPQGLISNPASALAMIYTALAKSKMPAVWLCVQTGMANERHVEYWGFFGPEAKNRTPLSLGLQSRGRTVDATLLFGVAVELKTNAGAVIPWSVGQAQQLVPASGGNRYSWSFAGDLVIIRTSFPTKPTVVRFLATPIDCPPDGDPGGYDDEE